MPNHDSPSETSPRESKKARTSTSYISPEVVWSAANNGNTQALDFIAGCRPTLLKAKKPGDHSNIAHIGAKGSKPVAVLNWVHTHCPDLLDETTTLGANLALMALWDANIEALEWLWTHKRDFFYALDKHGNDAVTIAALSDDDTSIAWLHKKEASMLAKQSGDFLNIAYCAASYGSIHKLRWILSNCPDHITALDEDEDNIAHLACTFERAGVLKWINEQESLRHLLTQPNKAGETPIDTMNESSVKAIQAIAAELTSKQAHGAHHLFAKAGAAEDERSQDAEQTNVDAGPPPLRRRPSTHYGGSQPDLSGN